MLYVRQPTDEERRELERMVRQEIGRVGQRTQMILSSTRRKTIPEIVDAFDVCLPTVRFWIHRFEGSGPDGLYDRPRSGRPRKIIDEVRGMVVQLIQEDP